MLACQVHVVYAFMNQRLFHNTLFFDKNNVIRIRTLKLVEN